MEFFRVTDFESLQHYKDRTPPWIKLYNSLLDDYNFACLQDASKLHLLMIYLLASRSDNKIPVDAAWIGKRISATEEVDLTALFASGLIEKIVEESKDKKPKKVDSKTLAECEQDACLEGEGETEEERELKNINKKFSLDFSPWPQLPSAQVLDDWMTFRKKKRAPVNQTVVEQMGRELRLAVDHGFTTDQCLSVQQVAGWQGYKFEWHKNRESGNANSNRHPGTQGLSRSDAAFAEYQSRYGEPGNDSYDAEYIEIHEAAESDGRPRLPRLGVGVV